MSNILPFYLVCDESYSMEGAPIDAMNQALPELHTEIGTNPVVCDKTRFAIITFSGEAQVLQPLADLSQIRQLPMLSAKGGTSFAAAFRLLRTEIDQDIVALKKDGHRVFRPAVFFLTDGQPTDPEGEWLAEFEMLTDKNIKHHPNIIAFGIGEADASVIKSIGTAKAFLAETELSPAAALKEFAKALTRSIINSGSGPADQLSPQMPDVIQGFTALDSPEV